MENDLPKRDPRNAPGPFYAVEKLCLSCGLPENEAPELLADLDGANFDTYFVKQPTTPEEVERACRALDVCCVKALRYAGDDPAIIQRLQKWSAECCDAAEGQRESAATSLCGRSVGFFSQIRNWFWRHGGH